MQALESELAETRKELRVLESTKRILELKLREKEQEGSGSVSGSASASASVGDQASDSALAACREQAAVALNRALERHRLALQQAKSLYDWHVAALRSRLSKFERKAASANHLSSAAKDQYFPGPRPTTSTDHERERPHHAPPAAIDPRRGIGIIDPGEQVGPKELSTGVSVPTPLVYATPDSVSENSAGGGGGHAAAAAAAATEPKISSGERRSASARVRERAIARTARGGVEENENVGSRPITKPSKRPATKLLKDKSSNGSSSSSASSKLATPGRREGNSGNGTGKEPHTAAVARRGEKQQPGSSRDRLATSFATAGSLRRLDATAGGGGGGGGGGVSGTLSLAGEEVEGNNTSGSESLVRNPKFTDDSPTSSPRELLTTLETHIAELKALNASHPPYPASEGWSPLASPPPAALGSAYIDGGSPPLGSVPHAEYGVGAMMVRMLPRNRFFPRECIYIIYSYVLFFNLKPNPFCFGRLRSRAPCRSSYRPRKCRCRPRTPGGLAAFSIALAAFSIALAAF